MRKQSITSEGTYSTENKTNNDKTSTVSIIKVLDKPKRPLSAYNYFLKEERKRIISNVISDTEENSDTTDSDSLKRPLKKRRIFDTNHSSASDNSEDSNSSRISFAMIGQMIGKRWHEVKMNPEVLAVMLWEIRNTPKSQFVSCFHLLLYV